MAEVIICSDFGAKGNKMCHCFHFPHLFAMKWCHDLSFLNIWVLSQLFPFSSFTFIKRFFSSSSLSAIRVVSSAYLRLLIFLPTIFIPACESSSPELHMMCPVCKLNKQGDNMQPCTPFPILNQSVVPCKVLTVASWPTYSFLRRQVRWPGIPISLRIFHNLLWSTQSKAFYIVNEADIYVLLKFEAS